MNAPTFSAFSTRRSSSITVTAARIAAPGHRVAAVARARARGRAPRRRLRDLLVEARPETGKPAPRPLPIVTTSGTTPQCSQPNHCPVRPKPQIISSLDEQRVVLLGDRLDRGHELRRGDDVAGRALDRLDQDRGERARRRVLDHLARELGALDAAGGVLEPERAAVAVGVRRVVGARAASGRGGSSCRRRSATACPRSCRGSRPRTRGTRTSSCATWRAASRPRPPRCRPSRAGSSSSPGGVCEATLLQRLGAARRRERADRDLVDLGLQDLAVARVRVAEGVDADAGGDVEESVAVDVLDQASPRPGPWRGPTGSRSTGCPGPGTGPRRRRGHGSSGPGSPSRYAAAVDASCLSRPLSPRGHAR